MYLLIVHTIPSMQIVFNPYVFTRERAKQVPMFDLLPSEIILQITMNLAWRELLALEMCSKRLKQVSELNILFDPNNYFNLLF